jgi:hypothetical protein
MLSSKEEKVGSTVSQGVRSILGVVLGWLGENRGLERKQRSAARRPWTVIGPIAAEIDFGTV